MKHTSNILIAGALLLAALLIGVAVFLFRISGSSGASASRNIHEKAQAEIPAQSFCCSLTQIAWFYKPPIDGNLALVAQNFDTFVLTKNDEAERDTLKSLGVTAPILRYLRFEAIHDPGSCTAQPLRNQVADQPGDFCWIRENHPDWFLYDAAGDIIYSSDSFALMDPGNPGWREYWVTRTMENQAALGWDGVFLDNVEGSFSKRERLDRIPAAYPNEAAYLAAIEGFLQYMYTGYFQPRNMPLEANIVAYETPEVWYRFLQYLDGAMLEGWAVDWSDGYRSEDTWLEHLHLIEQTQALGKQAIALAQGDYTNASRQQFTYASFLLVSWGRASFRYGLANHYNEIWLYDNYDIDLGAPLGPRYYESGLWKRDFENGSVSVDPKNHSATISTNAIP